MKALGWSRGALLLVAGVLCLAGCGGSSDSGGGGGGTVVGAVVEQNYSTQTADGWTLSFKRYSPLNGEVYNEPVLLLQGYLESSRIFNIDPVQSLAHHLAAKGFDVWTFDLRGTGDSQKPTMNFSNIGFQGFNLLNLSASFGMTGWNYSIDHFVLLDTPAAVDYVLTSTGRPQLIMVGHSMGGLMTYGYLQTNQAGRVRAAVTLGGVGKLTQNGNYQNLFARLFFQFGTMLSPIIPSNFPLPLATVMHTLFGDDPLRWSAITYAMTTIPVTNTSSRLLWNPENFNSNLAYQFLRNAFPNTSTTCFKQVMSWYRNGECVSKGVQVPIMNFGLQGTGAIGIPYQVGGSQVTVGRNYNYTRNLNKVTAPILVIAGGDDRQVPAADVKKTFDLLGSTDKTYAEFSKANGASLDYGHIDLAVGQNTTYEVYPVISDWLGTKASRR